MLKRMFPILFGTLWPLILSGCYLTPQEYAHDQAVALCGVISKKPAGLYYMECEEKGGSFPSIMQCGKESRAKACHAQGSCSQQGNEFVAYADSLVLKVESGELSEDAAFREWDSYKKSTGAPSSVRDYQTKIADRNEKARECYQQSVPQFLATETARRSAIDAAAATRQPVHTTCTGGAGVVNCTSW